jgi:hypothetical protein
MHTITLTNEQLHELHVILMDRMHSLSHEIRTAPHDIVKIAHRQFDRADSIMEAISSELAAAAMPATN